MAHSIAYHRNRIVRTLKTIGSYHDGLMLHIIPLAGLCRAIELVVEEIDKLDSPTIQEEDRYGNLITKPNPIFRQLRDLIKELAAQLKQLNLTVADILGTPDVRDNADEVIDRVNAIQ